MNGVSMCISYDFIAIFLYFRGIFTWKWLFSPSRYRHVNFEARLKPMSLYRPDTLFEGHVEFFVVPLMNVGKTELE